MRKEPVTLDTLNWDVLMEIVQHELDAQDLCAISQVSKRLRAFTMDKSPWIAFLRGFAHQHPLPIPPFRDIATLTLSELQELAIHSSNLHQNWLSDEPRPKQAYRVISLRPLNSIVSMLQLPRLPYIITLMKDGLVSCLSIDSGKPVSQYRPRALVSSWRMEPLEDESVMVILLVGPEDRSSISVEIPAEFVTLHLTPPNDFTKNPGYFTEISSYRVTSPVTGLFTTTEIAGLISADTNTKTAVLLVTSPNAPNSVSIDTGIFTSNRPNASLNAVAQLNDLLLYKEESGSASLYTYDIHTDILPFLSLDPRSSHFIPPTHHSTYKLHPDQLCEDAQAAYTIVRTKGRPFQPYHGAIHDPPELSVLTMSFVLGQDATGEDDHRCISHMYIHPSKLSLNERISQASASQEKHEHYGEYQVAESLSDSLPPSPSSSASSSSSTTAPSPTITAASSLLDETHADNATSLQTFHSCLEEKAELWQGPGRNDLISVGGGASYAVWVSLNEQTGPELKLASFAEPDEPLPYIKRSSSHQQQETTATLPPATATTTTGLLTPPPSANHFNPTGTESTQITETGSSVQDEAQTESAESSSSSPHSHTIKQAHRKAMRTLKLPSSINPLEITAVTLEDTTGTLAIATVKQEIWLLDYAVAPNAPRAF